MTDARRIIFLCGEAEGEAFREHVERLSPGFETQWVSTAASLDFATRQASHRTRLISFLTSVIVPEEIIKRLGLVPYNVHPGSPEYPGAHGLSFAIYEGSRNFGVTAHELVKRVDTGAITLVDRFGLPDDAQLVRFGNEVYARAVAVVDMVIRHCLETDEPMRHRPDRWAPPQCTWARLNTLMASAEYLTPHDRDRLERACGPHLERYRKAQRKHG